MNINDVKEITVIFKNGKSITYRKRGLEKIRKRMSESPPLYKEGVTVVESDSSPPKRPPSPPKVRSKYQVSNFTYNTGADPHEMMKQAATQGLAFSP